MYLGNVSASYTSVFFIEFCSPACSHTHECIQQTWVFNILYVQNTSKYLIPQRFWRRLKSIPPPSLIFYRPSIVVKCGELIHLALFSAWFWLLFIQFSYHRCSSFPQFDIYIHYFKFFNVWETSPPRSGQVLYIFSAIKHGETRSLLLTNGSRKFSIILWNDFPVLIFAWHILLCRIGLYHSLKFPSNPNCTRFLIHFGLC